MGKTMDAEKKCLHLSQHLKEHNSFMLLRLCMHTSPRLIANPDSVHVV